MLEGLEATEVRSSTLLTGVETFRLDSEYYRREYIKIEHYIKDHPNLFCKFSDLGISIDCSAFYAGIEPLYGFGSIPLIRVQNVKDTIDYANCVTLPFLTEPQHSTLKTVEEGDIVITKGGSIGFVGYVTQRAYASRDLIFLKSSAIEEDYRIFLFLYLSSPFAFKQLIRSSSQCAQPHLTITLVKNFDILKAQEGLVKRCSQLYKKHREALCLSKSLYSSAENYLLECLGMQDFVANPDAYNIKTLKESFLESGRIDTEYYLPKYEDYFKAVSAYTGGVAPLCEICTIKDSNYTPEDKQTYRYIELAHIGKSGDITGCLYEKGEDLPTRARRLVTTGDVIVSSIEGSLGSCALVTEDYDHALCSTGFYVVRSSQINSETLLTLFKSEPIQQLLKKGCSGTILTGIGKQEFEQIPIPLIRSEVQEEIAQHIQRSFDLRKEASQLLEEAKLSVEQAIEMGGKSLIYNKLKDGASKEERLAMYLLLKELGLINEKPQRHKVVATEKKLSASFFTSDRLDAEYYQPKYDYLDSQLAQLSTKRLGELVEMRKSIEPGSDAYQTEGIPFVRVSDLNKFGLETPSVCLDRATYATAPRPQKNTILLSKDGSVGIAYKVEADMDVITSGAILHLSVKEKSVLPDYLTLVLNSPIVKMQAERDAGGSIIQHWKPSEIEQVVIPILPPDIQQKLSEQVSKSFALRREAGALLAEAKAMVERAIEATA